MSVSRPAQCLFRRRIACTTPSSSPSSSTSTFRTFSSTSTTRARKIVRPIYEQLDEKKQTKLNETTRAMPRYTREEKDALKNYYSPEQMEALREAEKAIDLRDLVTQGKMRTDQWSPRYIDDFAYIDPFLDKKQIKEPTYAKPLREISTEEFNKKVVRRMKDPRTTDELFAEAEKLTLKPEVKEFIWKLRRWKDTDKEDYVREILHQYVAIPDGNPEDVLDDFGINPSDPFWLADGPSQAQLMDPDYDTTNQAIPRMDDPMLRWPTEDQTPEEAALQQVANETGRDIADIKSLRVKNLVFKRVVNQTRMGKIPSMYTLSIAGNGNGLLGIGEGKAAEATDSRRQAMIHALRNVKPIVRYENRTIYGHIKKKVGGTTVEITAKPPGFGIRCQHLIFEICRCAGIHDLSARVGRARNPMNTIKAMFEALTSQKMPDDIARARGRKLVDLRKVYYDGNV